MKLVNIFLRVYFFYIYQNAYISQLPTFKTKNVFLELENLVFILSRLPSLKSKRMFNSR